MNHGEPGHRRTPAIYLVIIGLGLLLAGSAALLLLPKPQATASVEQQLSSIPVETNFPAPELELTDVQGTPVSLAAQRGQVVLVNLWATWCPPCKKEMPTLQTYYENHKAQGFAVVAINDGDPTADVLKFVQDYKLTFPVWLDPTYTATEKAFQVMNLPSSFVIDRKGVVRLRWVGEISEQMLEEYVTPIITE